MSLFVTVGLAPFPFDRLVRGVDEAKGEGRIEGDVFIQTGASAWRPRFCEGRAYLGFAEMRERMRRADVVVAHAGVGTVLMAFAAGRVPIIVPRRGDRGEHVDDHQAGFARAIESRGGVLVGWEDGELVELIARHRRLFGSSVEPVALPADGRPLTHYLESALADIAGRNGGRRP